MICFSNSPVRLRNLQHEIENEIFYLASVLMARHQITLNSVEIRCAIFYRHSFEV